MLTLYFDYVSAASVVAVLRLQRLADAGAPVAFSGFDPLGLDATLPLTLDQLAEIDRYRARASELGFELRRPSRRPPTLRAHLLGERARDEGLGASWRDACLRAYWQEDADLGEEATLHRLAVRAGLDEHVASEALADREGLLQLRQRLVALRGRGVGGVPVLEVAGGTFVSAELSDEDLRTLAALGDAP